MLRASFEFSLPFSPNTFSILGCLVMLRTRYALYMYTYICKYKCKRDTLEIYIYINDKL